MKLTQAKRKWVIKKVNHYSNLLEVESPKIFFTMSEYNNWKKSIRQKRGEHVGRSQCLGVCHRDNKFIVILVKRSTNLAELDDTIRHEMLHYTKSYGHYSDVLKDRMERLKKGKIKGGRFC